MRVLFILKKKHYHYGHEHEHDGAGGLLNSSQFVADMLSKERGFTVKLVIVNDNNDIDREVTAFKPDVVVIEALWVVPEKFDILKWLHPTVKWIVSVHSNPPFLAHEGIAVEWITGYLDRGVYVAFNAEPAYNAFRVLFPRDIGVLYLPNFYPVVDVRHINLSGLHIGCFGAIRPMKNQLTQAIAAIEYADRKKISNMSFHVNAPRLEHGGSNVLRNLRALFEVSRHQLVEHPWMSHADFLALVAMMDVEMAVSFSETFCITAADAVTAGTALVCSDQIPWAARVSMVSDPTSTDEIIKVLDRNLHPWWSNPQRDNRNNLIKYSAQSRKLWLTALAKLCNNASHGVSTGSRQPPRPK